MLFTCFTKVQNSIVARYISIQLILHLINVVFLHAYWLTQGCNFVEPQKHTEAFFIPWVMCSSFVDIQFRVCLGIQLSGKSYTFLLVQTVWASNLTTFPGSDRRWVPLAYTGLVWLGTLKNIRLLQQWSQSFYFFFPFADASRIGMRSNYGSFSIFTFNLKVIL